MTSLCLGFVLEELNDYLNFAILHGGQYFHTLSNWHTSHSWKCDTFFSIELCNPPNMLNQLGEMVAFPPVRNSWVCNNRILDPQSSYDLWTIESINYKTNTISIHVIQKQALPMSWYFLFPTPMDGYISCHLMRKCSCEYKSYWRRVHVSCRTNRPRSWQQQQLVLQSQHTQPSQPQQQCQLMIRRFIVSSRIPTLVSFLSYYVVFFTYEF